MMPPHLQLDAIQSRYREPDRRMLGVVVQRYVTVYNPAWLYHQERLTPNERVLCAINSAGTCDYKPN